jgi:hypothetical protein
VTKLLQPPKNGAELREQVIKQFHLESAPALAMLDVAAEALDQAIEADKITARRGLVVRGSRGPVPNPSIHIAAQARHRMLRALRSLDLEL